MRNYLLFCTLMLLSVNTIAQTPQGFAIDPAVKSVVEQNISSTPLSDIQSQWIIVNARIYLELYQSDSMLFTTFDQEVRQLFKSFYYWKGDTLNMDAAYGMFGGFGANIKIINGRAFIYHLLASDEIPSYAYTQDEPLRYRLEVPCVDTQLKLSELPDSTQNQVVYGYVEFKSSDYYVSSGSLNGVEVKHREKKRANMKIYFKSGRAQF